MNQSWTAGSTNAKRGRFVLRRLVLPTLIPVIIVGGLLAAIAVPTVNQRTVVLSLFMDPVDGVIVAVNGPHRYFACTPVEPIADEANAKDSPQSVPKLEKSHDEYNDLNSLAQRLKALRKADNLVLVVSAVARNDAAGVQLMPDASNAADPAKMYLQDLMRVVNRSAAKKRLVLLDVQWQINPESDNQSCEPTVADAAHDSKLISNKDSLHSRISSVLLEHGDQKTTYVLTAGPNSWASGMENPRDSAFLHFWRQALSSKLADDNSDGRLSIRESLDYVRHRLAEWSSRNCQSVQSPVLIGDANFDLGPVQPAQPIVSDTPPYPNWLLKAWQKRDAYLSRYDIAADAEFLDQWQCKLLAIESRWRRALNDVATEAETVQVNLWAEQQIMVQCQQASANRPDSLCLAAKATAGSMAGDQADVVTDQIINQLQQVKTLPQDPATEKVIEPILAAAVKDLNDPQKLSLLDSLIRRLSSDASFSPTLALTTGILARQLKVDSSYAETLALQQIIAAGPPFDELDQALLRLNRLRSQLGERPSLFAVMSPRLDYLLNECLTAEQFYWFDGFTTEENVRRQVTAALTRVEVGLSQQQCIEQAISTAEQAIAFLRCGQALPHHETSFLEILDTTEKLTSALYRHSASSQQATIDSIAIRFESIRYLTEQLQSDMENLLAVTVAHADSCSCDALLSIVPAAVRPQVYEKLLEGKNLQSAISVTHLCNQGQKLGSEIPRTFEAHQHHQVRYAELIQRIEAIEQATAAAQNRGLSLMGAWLQHLAQSIAETHDPSGFYQSLTNRMTFRSGGNSQSDLAFEWTGAPISWQNRKTQLMVSLPKQKQDGDGLKLTMLDTASSSLRIVPSGTTATPASPGRFEFELGIRSDQESQQPVKGVWIRSEYRGVIQYVPVRFPEIQSCQLVELQMHGCQINDSSERRWRVWPKENRQSFEWTLVNHDDAVRNVVVTVRGDNQTLLESSPLPLPPTIPQPIRFPAATPTPLGSQNVQSQPSIDKLTILVNDAKTNEVLLEQSLELELVDVRSCLQVVSSRFDVLEHGGANRLLVQLKGTAAADPAGHQVQLGLNTQHLPTLVGIGSGNATVQVSPNSSAQALTLKNLSIAEGPQSLWSIPLIVDGDAEAIRLNAFTPYTAGTTDWQLETEPRLFLSSPAAAIPGSVIQVQVGGMNMQSSERLLVKFGQQSGGQFVVYHQVELLAPRASQVRLSSGGAAASVNLDAYFDRWNVPLPTELVNGKYEVRACSKSNATVCAASDVLLDDQAPIIASAFALPDDLTKIYVQTISGPSGIATVSMLAADKSLIKAIPCSVSGNESQQADQWLVQSKQPVSLQEQTVVTVEATSNAGKTVTVDLPVKVETPSTLGTLEGIVLEGSIPQPGMAVAISDSAGKQYQLITNTDGTFRGSLPAGDYRLSVEKRATGRRAQTTIKVQSNKSTHATLELLLPRAAPRA